MLFFWFVRFLKRRFGDRLFRKTHAAGFYGLNVPDIQSYFPSFWLGKKISLSAKRRRLCTRKFSEENLTKDSKPPLPRARQFISAL